MKNINDLIINHRVYIKAFNELNAIGGNEFIRLIDQKNKLKEIESSKFRHDSTICFEELSEDGKEILSQIETITYNIKKNGEHKFRLYVRDYCDMVNCLIECLEKEKQTIVR